MSGTIFDLVQSEPRDGQEGFFDLATNSLPKKKTFLNKANNVGKAALKGAAEGVHALGRAFGPIPTGENEQEKFSESLDQLIPSEEGYVGSGLRRGLQQAPTALAFPGSTLTTLPRAIAAGFLGEGAKELGAPEWAQTAAELTGYLGPDVAKRLLSSGKNKELIDAAREFGLSDKQITPLIQSDFKQKWLSKFSPRRGYTEEALRSTKGALGEAYENIQGSETALRSLPEKYIPKLKEQIGEKLFNMPSKVRGKLKQDTVDLFSKPVTGETLINYYRDVNKSLGSKSRELSLLKAPIRSALKEVSPELERNFDLINKLYTKYYPIANKLKPTLATDVYGLMEGLGAIGAVTTGHFPYLIKIAGEHGARKIVQHMLLNPRLQNLSGKIAQAAKENKFEVVKKLMDSYSKNIRKTSPEFADELEKLSLEDIENFMSNQQIGEQ